MQEQKFEHTTVLLKEAIDALAIKSNGCYLDGTFGRGGHSSLILKKLAADGQLLAIDKDPQAIIYAQQQFAGDSRFQIAHGTFADLDLHHCAAKMRKLDGILLDLGVSSPQFDDASRGFSFRYDAELDMRMDTTSGISASQWLAQADIQEMSDIFKRYGEEKLAKKIARRIDEVRQQQPITRTTQLADLIAEVYPKPLPHKPHKIHPATKCFQAIRLHINQELPDLEVLLSKAVDLLAPGGRLVVISFHSLEDRIVKRFMRDQEQGKKKLGLALTDDQLDIKLKRVGKAIKASEEEIKHNRRSRSAIMRVAERYA